MGGKAGGREFDRQRGDRVCELRAVNQRTKVTYDFIHFILNNIYGESVYLSNIPQEPFGWATAIFLMTLPSCMYLMKRVISEAQQANREP